MGDSRGMSVGVALICGVEGCVECDCVNGSEGLCHVVGTQTVLMTLSIQTPCSAWL